MTEFRQGFVYLTVVPDDRRANGLKVVKASQRMPDGEGVERRGARDDDDR